MHLSTNSFGYLVRLQSLGKTDWRTIGFFLSQIDGSCNRKFSLDEIARKLNVKAFSAEKSLDKLHGISVVIKDEKDGKVAYRLHPQIAR